MKQVSYWYSSIVTLKDNLQKQLKKNNLTLAQLARLTGLPKSTVHSIGSIGQSAVNLTHIKKIATALKVSVHELCYGEPDPFEIKTDEVLKELFTGDLRVSIHKIERTKARK